MTDVIRKGLWSEGVSSDTYGGEDTYRAAIMEQYKLYVEMADRVSSRRSVANAFFLTLNSAIFAVVGIFWRHQPSTPPWWLTFPLALVLTQCLAWFWLVRSYRQLNTAKWAVVGAIEERLPASPYWGAEWQALGEGKDRRRYFPVTHLEQRVPVLFAATYIAGYLAVLLTF